MMQRAGLFLGRFQHLLPPHHQLKAALREIILKHCDVAVPLEAIQIQGNTVYLKIKPILKNTIYPKQKEILAELNSPHLHLI